MQIDSNVRALAAFGFTPRQTQFLCLVLSHAGVCIGRQYAAFAGIAYGQTVRDFLTDLVARGFATAYPCGHNRARIYHLHSKTLYRAIGDPNSRLRRPAYLARAVERLMILDAILSDLNVEWLATERDKVRHCLTTIPVIQHRDLPALTFNGSTRQSRTVRYFPDRLPIGIDRDHDRHVFLYLVTRSLPIDFRAFLQRHSELLRALPRWVLRLLVPRHLQAAAAVYEAAFMQELARPLAPPLYEELARYFRARRALDDGAASLANSEYRAAQRAFAAPRYQALYRAWHVAGDTVLHAARSRVLADAIERGTVGFEMQFLSHTYHHFSHLVGTA